jgi:hypothetical protein
MCMELALIMFLGMNDSHARFITLINLSLNKSLSEQNVKLPDLSVSRRGLFCLNGELIFTFYNSTTISTLFKPLLAEVPPYNRV